MSTTPSDTETTQETTMSSPSTTADTTTTITHVETLEECCGDENDDLPTVLLGSESAQEVPTARFDLTTEKEEDSEVLVAQPIVTCSVSEEEEQQPNHYANARAEYLSATFLRNKNATSLGLKLKNRRITYIRPNSLAGQSPLRVGDKLLSINGRMCRNLSPQNIVESLKAPGTMTLVVHNDRLSRNNTTNHKASHNHNIVECMITKAHQSDKIGLGLKPCGDYLELGSIHPHKAAALTLLNAEDQILAINGVPAQQILTAKQASDVIGAAEHYVTIKVLTSQGIVLGEERTEQPKELVVPEAEEETPSTPKPVEEESPLPVTKQQQRSTSPIPLRARNLFRSTWQTAAERLRDPETQQRLFGLTTTPFSVTNNNAVASSA